MKKVIYLVWQGQHEDKVLKIATEDKEIAWRWAAHHKRTGVQYAQPDTTVTEIELTNYAAYEPAPLSDPIGKTLNRMSLPARCPKCGSTLVSGYGLAGGGMGAYVWCSSESCGFFQKEHEEGVDSEARCVVIDGPSVDDLEEEFGLTAEETAEFNQLTERCEMGVVLFTNDDLSAALVLVGRLRSRWVSLRRLEATQDCKRALAGLEMLFRREGEDATATFERMAEAFMEETHFMRPGKSQPIEMLASDEQRVAAYEHWIAAKLKAARKLLA